MEPHSLRESSRYEFIGHDKRIETLMNALLRSLFILLGMIYLSSTNAQNLVPNGNFDETVECPFGNALLEGYCASWFRSQFDADVLPSNIPSPDFYHTCGLTEGIVPPSLFSGYQEAFEGRGFVGIVTYDGRC